jgi:hypothetical protein
MAGLQPYGLSCKGGLNTNLNQFEMLQTPGSALELENFEVDTDGGYRRVQGFTRFGSSNPNGSNPILGLFVYADGLIAASGTDLFFTLDGTTWLQINRSSVDSGGDNYSTFTSRSVLTITNQGQCNFALYDGSSQYGELVITNEASAFKPVYFKMTGTGALTNRTYFFREITVSGTVYPTVCTIHDRHLVVGGDANNPNTIYYSGTNTIENFTSSSAGSITFDDKVVGIKSFRQDLVIFAKNSIYKLVNINDSASIAVQPVTTNVGCLDNHTIQEVAGDLVFLAPDGFRTVAGTARIGDVELSSVSRQIQEVTEKIAADIKNLIVSSAVLRQKSQYRIFYSGSEQQPADSLGIIGTLTREGFVWSTTKGLQARAFVSGFDSDKVEQTFHGDKDGFVYRHDSQKNSTESSFIHNGVEVPIRAQYKTPHFDFGDFGTRKNIRYIKISFTPLGDVLPTLRVRYDYEDLNTPQPEDYTLETIPIPALFGTGLFNKAVFGASNDPLVRQAIQGAGHSVSFRITTDDKRVPYAVNGMYIHYMPETRR